MLIYLIKLQLYSAQLREDERNWIIQYYIIFLFLLINMYVVLSLAN